MGSSDLFRALTQTLREGATEVALADDVRLTPYLTIVTAILYMMAVDGDISDHESSQLQSVIGTDEQTLRRAVAYAQTHDVEAFLREAPTVLDDSARLCLLVNVADSLMADGELQKVELMLFDRMLTAFGQTRTSFQPHFDAIAAKGKTSVLGDFGAAAATEDMTPPKALVVAMLYMISADGAMATEEIGRLSTVIRGSQPLLKASLRYVSQVRAPQFLALAAGLLDRRQRMCVLLNACDAMMSDRKVVTAERELFGRMLAAFGVEASALDAYVSTMRVKNAVPRDDAPPAMPAARAARPRPEGQLFERKRTWEEETGEAGRAASASNGPLDERISHTMQDNIDRMSGEFDDGLTLARIERHSRSDAPETATARHAVGAVDLRSEKDAQGATDLRATRDSAGPSGLRESIDADGAHSKRPATDRNGPRDRRTAMDAQGLKDARRATDNDGIADRRASSDSAGSSDKGSATDVQGLKDGRTSTDADGASDLRIANDLEGPADLRSVADGDGLHDQRSAKDAEGLHDQRAAKDAAAKRGRAALHDAKHADAAPHWQDAKHGHATPHWQDAKHAEATPHWKDAALSADRRDLRDAAGLPASKHLQDDRRAFDAQPGDESGNSIGPDASSERMDAVSQRTDSIRTHVEAMKRSRSLRAGSRLPSLPLRQRPPTHAHLLAGERLATDSGAIRDSDEKDNHERMLLASDEGGPIMSESTQATNPDSSKNNRRLRVHSAVLLPALFVTYGATMVGETLSERLFITNENIATDARIVHQMASVQQSVYRIAPDTVQLLPGAIAAPVAANAVGAVSAGAENASGDSLTDREKADSFLEQRKTELQDKFQKHQSSSALAAERQQWFIYAKSIVLLGLGMAFWGVLFRSLRMLNVSTASGLVALLLSANGYWLFLRF